ncbi:MAG TPA: hypothetical protein VKU80_04410 [Planctomycetota bacterium]|nr:hypothetical protein [Planctomycetota bacterium]
MTMKKSGSLLGSIMRSREQAPEEPAAPLAAAPRSAEPLKAAPPAPKPAPQPAPAPGASIRLLAEVEGPKPEPPTMVPPGNSAGKGTAVPAAPSTPELKPHRLKKSYSIKASNVEALELLAWFMDKPDSQVVDQALDLLVQTMGRELEQAAALKAARSGHRAAV